MTYHSIYRTTQRANVTMGTAVKMIEKAKCRGVEEKKLPLRERRYLEKKRKQNVVFIFYIGYLFLIGPNGECVTMYEAPEWFFKKGRYDGKTVIKKARKYQRCNPVSVWE